MTNATASRENPLETPVALCIFNRPDVTQRVFSRIAEVRPKRLFIFADGPRPKIRGERERTDATREIVSKITWDCEVQRWYSDINLGCRQRMQSGIDWVFGKVERAIVLEDDTLPSLSFFRYCERLLEKYADDPRVMMISGDHFQPEEFQIPSSYYFSKWPHIWGWATWRRAWRHNSSCREIWDSDRRDEVLRSVFPREDERVHWRSMLESSFRGEVDTWDFQWCFAIWAQGGLTALPARNLVTNIGFDHRATHTTDSSSRWANLPAFEWNLGEHPAEVRSHEAADRWTFENVFAATPGAVAKDPLRVGARSHADRRPAIWKHVSNWFHRTRRSKAA